MGVAVYIFKMELQSSNGDHIFPPPNFILLSLTLLLLFGLLKTILVQWLGSGSLDECPTLIALMAKPDECLDYESLYCCKAQPDEGPSVIFSQEDAEHQEISLSFYNFCCLDLLKKYDDEILAKIMILSVSVVYLKIYQLQIQIKAMAVPVCDDPGRNFNFLLFSKKKLLADNGSTSRWIFIKRRWFCAFSRWFTIASRWIVSVKNIFCRGFFELTFLKPGKSLLSPIFSRHTQVMRYTPMLKEVQLDTYFLTLRPIIFFLLMVGLFKLFEEPYTPHPVRMSSTLFLSEDMELGFKVAPFKTFSLETATGGGFGCSSHLVESPSTTIPSLSLLVRINENFNLKIVYGFQQELRKSSFLFFRPKISDFILRSGSICFSPEKSKSDSVGLSMKSPEIYCPLVCPFSDGRDPVGGAFDH